MTTTKSDSSTDILWRHSAGLITSDLDDELLIRDSSGTRVHRLNKTGREVFLLMDGVNTVRVIADRLGEKYGRELMDDVRGLVARLERLGLIVSNSAS